MPKFDYSKLLGKIKEKGYTHAKFAHCISIAPSTLSLILSGNGYFKQPIIERICSVLGIDKKDIGAYFFTQRV